METERIRFYISTRSYLSSDEVRSNVRGTTLQKSKQRTSISFAVNADGSHKVPLRYIGTATRPQCFCDHPGVSVIYTSQANVWMDGGQFNQFIICWSCEVKKLSSGSWLVILGNCGGHGLDLNLNGVSIEFLRPNTAAVHQILHIGIIDTSKIRYRSILLRPLTDIVLRTEPQGHGFTDTTGKGR